MIKTMFALCLALCSINFASASTIQEKMKLKGISYNSGGATSEYIRLKLEWPASHKISDDKYLYCHLKKSNEALLYIFTVYSQKKSLYIMYDDKNYDNKKADKAITEINTID